MAVRLLFVDDEPLVLQALSRSFRSMRQEWQMEFVASGEDALAAMARNPFDVIITDMRMPGLDGAELLEEVKLRFPRTIRFVLSGQSSHEAVLRSIAPAHQYLSKPCDLDELKQKLSNALVLKDVLENPAVKEVISQLRSVPSLPSLYLQIVAELQTPDTSVAKIAAIISGDMGMCAKLLQLVNSAFFGIPCHVANPAQAVSLLGFDNIRALVLSVHIFSALDSNLVEDLSILWKHSLMAASFAKRIMRCQGVSQEMADEAFTAGLLHDVGILLLASSLTDQYRALLQKAASPLATWRLEQETWGCTHGEIGGYLMGLWGLPAPIVEAVAWHHRPGQAGRTAFSPVVAVHVADQLQYHTEFPGQEREVDSSLLEQLGLGQQLPAWEEACLRVEC